MVFLQFATITESPQNPDGKHPGRLAGLHVDGGITDIQAFGRLNVEQRGDFQGSGGTGFFLDPGTLTEDGIEFLTPERNSE